MKKSNNNIRFKALLNPSRFPLYTRRCRRLLQQYPGAEIVNSHSPDHFVEEVKKFVLSDFEHLLIWGGDGTAHLAINACMELAGEVDLQKKHVGFLRGGSGNGIQDSYEVPYSIRRQVEMFVESIQLNYTQKVDLLQIECGNLSRYGQLVGTGFDAEVLFRRNQFQTVKTDRKRKIRAGILRYVASGIATLLLKSSSFQRDYDLLLKKGKYALKGTRTNAEFPFVELHRRIKPLMLEVGTRPYYAKMFKVCPDVVCNDGVLDVYAFCFPGKLSAIRHSVSLWNGWHGRINKKTRKTGSPLIERYEVESVRIFRESHFRFHIDGELFTTEEYSERAGLEVRIVPSCMSFLVPPSFYLKFHPFIQEDVGRAY